MSYSILAMTRKRPAIAVFASGSGTTFRATADAIHDGLVDFDIALVVTDYEDAGVLQKVAEVNRLYGFNIQTEIINKKRYPGGNQGRGQTRAEAEALLAALKKYKIDHLALMGCMRIIAPQVVEEWGWRPEYAKKDPERQGLYHARMSNTHPGILPATGDTYGIHTQEKALELGLDETAHTLHAVSSGVDDGPIIAENRVRVFAPSKYPSELADTPEGLFARVQRIEKAHLPLDINAFLKAQLHFFSSATP
jgi:phosphoribosylglycinamide formyltransferase 1